MGHGSDAGRHVVWRQRLERFAGWTGTVAEFCRREGVAQPTFYQWRKRLRLAGERATGDAASGLAGARVADEAARGRARFVELSVAAAAAVAVEIELPNGAVVRVPADREATLRVAILAAGELGSSGQDAQPQEVSP
ncbi:MAG: transposase [Pirellulaceae bacterium]|nr:transposase [Pirellulaceae bacterium]MCU0980043.1 transposase [Pirellulaceae bacterium]